MSSTAAPRCPPAVVLVVAVVLVGSCLLSVSSPVAAHAEVKGSREYQNVKEDFLCRACVGLGEVFFEEVLGPIADRYRITPARTGVSVPSSASVQPNVTPPRQFGSHRQREQMIVEVHEAIDRLCDSLEKNIQRQSLEAVNLPADDVVARQLLSPYVTSKDLRDGVITACPMALEEINEALTNTAFNHLLHKKAASVRENRSTDHTRAADNSSSGASTTAASSYQLPAAGTFCEEAGLCSSFVHYHITSDAEVRRRARAAYPESSTTTTATRDETLAELKTDNNSSGGGSSTVKPRKGAAIGEKRSRKADEHTRKAKARDYAADAGEDETLRQTLHRMFQWHTWRQLFDSLNTTEVLSAGFWVQGLAMMISPDVLFHLQAYVPYMVVYSLCLVAVLVLVLVVVLVCRRTPADAALKHNTVDAGRPASDAGYEKKEQ